MTKMHQGVDNQRGYCLELANGLGWFITAAEGAESWVEKFVSMFGLTASAPNGCPRLVFVHRKAEDPEREGPTIILDSDRLKDFPHVGWTMQNVGSLRFWSHPRVQDMICEIGQVDDNPSEIVSMWGGLYPIYKQLHESGGLPLHAALVGRDGVGVLLAAPGRTGKSTCCRRLPSPWYALGDDETVIVRDHENQYLAHPFPTWSDYFQRRYQLRWNVQQCLPLSAIFFLEQAETDKAVPIGKGETTTRINKLAAQVCRIDWRNLPQAERISIRNKLFDNTCELARAIPAFELQVSLKGRFWEEIERVLRYK
ncbi:MAG: SynChlorMet cassette protein ScmC [Proteobacteria bacterium]|nr:SynChlorMet cassette protein ScmC [Pseudomonadota bacterium]